MISELEPRIAEILAKTDDMALLTRDEALTLMQVGLHTKEFYGFMEAANRMSRSQFREAHLGTEKCRAHPFGRKPAKALPR
jgi:hypothetical protein